MLGKRGVTEREFTVDWGDFGWEGRVLCVCVFGGGAGLLEVQVVTEREFTVYGGNFWEGSKRSGAKRSEAKRSVAKRSVA